MYRTTFDDESIEIKADGEVVAKFTDCGNGMQGKVEEFNEPEVMLPSQMIELAKWLLDKANDRIRHLED